MNLIVDTYSLLSARFELVHVAYHRWPVSLASDGSIGEGRTTDVAYWWLHDDRLVLADNEGEPTCCLKKNGNDIWVGRSVRNARQRIELVPVANSVLPKLMPRPDIGQGQTVDEIADLFRDEPRTVLIPGWWRHTVVHEAHHLLADESIKQTPPYPAKTFSGRGIVICTGGSRLFTNAWVCLRMLRHWGCTLPIQLWHLGEDEMDDQMRSLAAAYGAECIDAEVVRRDHPSRILGGWELKCYSILRSPFREVILLDADNVPLMDPTMLFHTPEYAEHGALFWPDYNRMEEYPTIWDACQVEYRDEPEFESGQIVVDKKRCWEAFNLTMHFNEHSDYYFRHMLGDKETFHMAFRRIGKSYAMPGTPIENLNNMVMCQHDFNARRIFQHRNQDKWKLDGSNCRIKGFMHEGLCRRFLAELRARWPGRVHTNDNPTRAEQMLINELGGRTYQYARIGYDERPLELLANRQIGNGSSIHEEAWTVTVTNGIPTLKIFGQGDLTCRLAQHNGGWEGRWCRHERMPVTLTPQTR